MLLAEGLLDCSLSALEWVAAWPMASWQPAAAPDWVWWPAAAGVLLLLAPRGLPGRWLGAVLLLPLLLVRLPGPAAGEVWLGLLDVGQGLSAVVRTRGHTLVYDLGPRFSDSFDAATGILLPYLRRAGDDPEAGRTVADVQTEKAYVVDLSEPLDRVLLHMAKEGKVLGYRFKGQRYDCGSLEGFVKATNALYEMKK